MAIYHYNESFISRSKNQSISASIAYVLKDKISDERYQKTHNYCEKKSEIVKSGIMCPNGAPEFSPQKLANEIERFEKGTSAQLGKRMNVALPKELSHKEQLELADSFLKSLKNEGRYVAWALHDKNGNNPHLDVIFTIRPWDSQKNSWGQKTKSEYVLDKNGNKILNGKGGAGRSKYKRRNISFDNKQTLLKHRKNWEIEANRALEKAGFAEKISCDTLEKQKNNAELMAKDEKLTEEQRENFQDKAKLLDRLPLQREVRGRTRENKIINKLIKKDLEEKKQKIRERKNLKKQIRNQYWRNKFAKNQTYIFKSYKEARKAFPEISKDLFATRSLKHQFKKMEKKQNFTIDDKSRSNFVSNIINKSSNPVAISVSDGQLKLHALPSNTNLLNAIENDERSGGGGVLQMPNVDDEDKFLNWNLASEFTKAKIKRKAILRNV